jgi:hypothetical protein
LDYQDGLDKFVVPMDVRYYGESVSVYVADSEKLQSVDFFREGLQPGPILRRRLLFNCMTMDPSQIAVVFLVGVDAERRIRTDFIWASLTTPAA